ncbi:MAG: hypothetical protein IPL79_00990 [Myxococcales bacterium]|nr:hypothetical protein [Myxococcales bacterium]
MEYYLVGSDEGFNELGFPDVNTWQKYMGMPAGLSKIWVPETLEYVYGARSKRRKDFDMSSYCEPLFVIGERALHAIGEKLAKYGEILELGSPKGFYFFHCTNVVDALVDDESEIVWLDKAQGWIAGINRFVLSGSKLKGHGIFRLPQANFRYTFFGEEFKRLIGKHRLAGIHFNRREGIRVA